MPKDISLLDEPMCTQHSPVGGLSDAAYELLVAQCQTAPFTKSPIGGLSLPEYLRIAGEAE